MTTTRLRNFVDAHVVEDRPTENFGKAGVLRIDAAGADEKLTYLFAAGGPRPGVYVLEATLSLFTHGATWSGTQTVTVKAVTEAWKERTVTWRTRPDVDATNQATVSVGAADPHTQVDVDVTDMVRHAFLGTGEPFYGFQLSGANGAFSSSESENPDVRPVLFIRFTELPAAAYDLVPGDSDVVSIPRWVQRWSYFDPDEGEQLAFHLQLSASTTVDGTGAFGSTTYDSGWVISSDPELDLATTAYAGLVDTGTVYAHVRVQNAAGQVGPWSDIVAIGRTSKGVLTLNSPTLEIEETTPTISTTLNGRDQRGLSYLIERTSSTVEVISDGMEWGEAWGGPWGGDDVVITSTNDEAAVTVFDKPRFKALADDGTDYDFEIPTKVIRRRAETYKLTVRSWDTVSNRVSTPGDPNYVEATQVFSWVDPASAPTSPAALAGVTDGPGLALTWTRAAVPDHYLILVDGQDATGYIDGLDAQIAGTDYGVTFYGLEPGTEHEIEVVAVVTSGGVKKTSKDNLTIDASTDVIGIWFVDRELGTTDEPATLVRLIGTDESPSAIGEDSEDLTASGRKSVITIVDNIRGYEGDVSGFIESADDRLILQGWKRSPSRVLRLVMGDLNIGVNLGALTIGRHPNNRGFYPVSVGVKQAGDPAEFPVQ